jgi:hydroxymethylpyrimidine/phosphomethylpyrimidine kinase
MSFSPPIVLTFAASDPTGGAGLQADVLTLASMGCHPLSVITGVTVQDTSGVHDMFAVDSDWVRDQARRVLEDMPVAAFKLGVLGSVDNIRAIADIVSDYPQVPLVLDPVLASGRGDLLASPEMADALRELLIPQTTILTPNSIEARRLAARHETEAEDQGSPTLAGCAARLLSLGCDYVLITGTHEPGSEVTNTLYASEGVVREDRWQRLPANYHGSGCTLASAIAAALANGLQVPEAVRDAQEYTWQALSAGFHPGLGQWMPDRFFWAREPQVHT